jgi:DNA uptake protein ComE-like DNA-binding protein
MSGIRSILIASVLALGIGLAPIAQAETPSTAPAKATTAPTPTSHTKSTSSKSSKSTAHIDLNSASREQLMTLPGIDEASADKIVQARPFKSKDELHSKGIVSKAEYDKLASHVTVKSSKPMSK